MNFFSFFRRNKGAQDKNQSVGRSSSVPERVGRRTSMAEPVQADPQLPEKRRARRRLIGSVILVIFALVVLPLVFESTPQKTNPNLIVDVNTKAPSSETPEPQPAPAPAEASAPADPNVASDANAPQQQGAQVTTPEPVQAAPAPEPVKETAAPADRTADKERAAAKAKADKERADAKAKADRERAEKERAAKKSKGKTAGDPIGQIIANKAKRR